MSYTKEDAAKDFVESVADYGDPSGVDEASLANAARGWIADAVNILASYDSNGYSIEG
jgi:hypothetical protein